MVAYRGGVAEVIAASPKIGRPLVGERILWVGSSQIRPDFLRCRAGKRTQPQFQLDVDPKVFPNEADPVAEFSPCRQRSLAQRHHEIGGVCVAIPSSSSATKDATL